DGATPPRISSRNGRANSSAPSSEPAVRGCSARGASARPPASETSGRIAPHSGVPGAASAAASPADCARDGVHSDVAGENPALRGQVKLPRGMRPPGSIARLLSTGALADGATYSDGAPPRAACADGRAAIGARSPGVSNPRGALSSERSAAASAGVTSGARAPGDAAAPDEPLGPAPPDVTLPDVMLPDGSARAGAACGDAVSSVRAGAPPDHCAARRALAT